MAMLLFTSFILIVIALAGTIWVAKKPAEVSYGENTKENYSRLTWIYTVTTVISVLFSALYMYLT